MIDSPKVGDVVFFRYHGAWVEGEVVGEGNSIRVPLKRFSSDPSFRPDRRRTYWRNKSRLFRPGDFLRVRSTLREECAQEILHIQRLEQDLPAFPGT